MFSICSIVFLILLQSGGFISSKLANAFLDLCLCLKFFWV